MYDASAPCYLLYVALALVALSTYMYRIVFNARSTSVLNGGAELFQSSCCGARVPVALVSVCVACSLFAAANIRDLTVTLHTLNVITVLRYQTSQSR